MTWWMNLLLIMVMFYLFVIVCFSVAEEQHRREIQGNIDIAMMKLRKLNSTITMMKMEIEWLMDPEVGL